MKCEYCGGNLGLEMEYCPYCGRPNEQAKRHFEEMRYYNQEFSEAKEDVYETTKRYTSVTVRIVIIAILLVATLIFLFIGDNAYSIRSDMEHFNAMRNYEEYSNKLEQYIAEEDYIGVYEFSEAKGIRFYDSPFEKYQPIYRASYSYGQVYFRIMEFVTGENDYMSWDEKVEYLADDLEYFYESTDMEQYRHYEGADCEENKEALAAMEDKVALLLKTYCGLTEEDLEGFDEISGARRQILLEERMCNEQ